MRLLRFAATWHWGQVVVVWIMCGIAIGFAQLIRSQQDSYRAEAWRYYESEGMRNEAEHDRLFESAESGFPEDRVALQCSWRDSQCQLFERTGIPRQIIALHERHIRERILAHGQTPLQFIRSDSLIRRTHRALADSVAREWNLRFQRELAAVQARGQALLPNAFAASNRARRIQRFCAIAAALATLIALATLWSWSSARKVAG